ncbi:Ig-like domain-containing protein [Rahnella bruchi]|uniref:Ig-like domain-containing protein n=1 Tax=Rahnella bruchi TaxID=1510573 RepID=UPI000EA0F898|nr:Ig-like domain-containing protein [Rahnella bruchi]
MSDSLHNNVLLAAQLASLPLDGNGGLIPTPAESGIARIDSANDNQGLHTGDIGQFGYTDDLTPTLGGMQEDFTAGLEITIFCNTQAIGTAIIGNDGRWSFTPDIPLESDHEYIFNTVVTDSATSNFLISLPYTLYTTEQNGDLPPDITLDSAVDNVVGYKGFTGALHSGDLTNDSRPDLSGHANAGALVNIYDNGELMGSTTANGQGIWTYKSAELSDGVHYLSASVFTAAGESHRSASFGITVDTHVEKPFIVTATDNTGLHTGFVANGGVTDDSRPVLNGHAEAGARVDIHVVGPNGKELYFETVHADENGEWTYQPQAFTSYGTYSFGISSVDAVGNAWYDFGDKFSVNYVGSNADGAVLPAITGITDDVGVHTGNIPDGGKTDDKAPALHGTGEPGDIVTLTMHSDSKGRTYHIATLEVGKDGTWSYQFHGTQAMLNGNNIFHITTQDVEGNTVSGSTYTVDLVGSNQDVERPDAPVIIEYFDNVGDASGEFKNGTTTDDTTPTLKGHAQAGSVVNIYEGSSLLGSATADKDGDWNFTPSARTEGKHTFTATATDAAGYASDTSADFVIYIDAPDSTPPDAPAIDNYYDDVGTSKGYDNNGGTTDDTTPRLNGHAEANSIVKVYDGSSLLGSTTADSDGDWSYTPSARGEGEHTFTATATDAAGNASGHSGNFVVNVETSSSGSENFDELSIWSARITGEFKLESGLTISDVSNIGSTYITNAWKWVDFFRDPTNENSLYIDYSEVKVSLSGGGAETVKLDVSAQEYFDVNNRVSYYNSEGELLGTQVPAVQPWSCLFNLDHMMFTAPVGEKISYFIISSPTDCCGILVDNIEWGARDNLAANYIAEKSAVDEVNHPLILSQVMTESNHSVVHADLTNNQQDKLHLVLNDILSEAHTNLFIQDGHKQLAITGDQGDVVELKVDDLAHNTWQDAGGVTSGGIQYEVYQHTGGDVELLVQHGLELHQVA